MAIKRQDLDETEEQRSSREAEEAEKAAAEEARRVELETARREKQEADLARARAEGEAEALKKNLPNQTQSQAWTDEQWEIEGQKRGFSGQQYKTMAETAAGIAQHQTAPLREQLEKTRRELDDARKETDRIKSRKNLDTVEAEFYAKNPALKGHRKTVDEFISEFPDSDKVDAKTYEKRLLMAADVVKGRVKEVRETMRNKKPGETGSGRFEGSETNEESENTEFDPRGTGNEGAASLMRGVMSNLGGNLRHEDSKEVYEKYKDDENRGVSISMDEDLAIAKANMGKSVLGGKRGS